ncbi:unnamed protein product [Effrenium voratum]|uniref:Protein kinase domain-containing protein n=1 Tax=Effrenium voratum TaxID=2562239 RepID=A0AA36JBK1_9DINO|nr:unnamed protein product [Effrenium voratum]
MHDRELVGPDEKPSAIRGVACAVTGPLWGNLVDSGASRKTLLQAGAGLWGICTFQLALTSNFVVMMMLRVLNGAALAMMVPVIQSFVADLTSSENCGSAFGKVACAANVGQVLACLMVTPISESTVLGMHGWRFCLATVGLLSLLTVLFVRAAVFEEPPVWKPRRFGLLRELRTVYQFLKIPTFRVRALEPLGAHPGCCHMDERRAEISCDWAWCLEITSFVARDGDGAARVRSDPSDPWVASWTKACEENSWLAPEFSKECGFHPWCKLCRKWADPSHLSTPKCQQRRQREGVTCGPHLRKLLETQGAPRPCCPKPPAAQPTVPKPPPTILKPPPADTGGFRRRCRNSHCTYLAHTDENQFRGYCCIACYKWEKEGYKKKTYHGARCQKEPADGCQGFEFEAREPGPEPLALTAGPGEPEEEPWRAPDFEVGGLRCFETKPYVSQVMACKGADLEAEEEVMSAGVIRARDPLVLIPSANGQILRAQVGPDLWITLAERQRGEWVESGFKEPPCTWRHLFQTAQNLAQEWVQADELWRAAESTWESFQKAQHELRDTGDCGGQHVKAMIARRDAARREALNVIEDFVREAANAQGQSCQWHGGAERKDAVHEAQNWRAELLEGERLDTKKELRDLDQQRAKVTVARAKMRSADTEWQNARDLDSQDAEQHMAERENCRTTEKGETRLYFHQMATLCDLASRVAPEMLPELRRHTEKTLETELRKLKPNDQTEVLKVLDQNISISHYDPEQLQQARRLSEPNARHGIYEMTYEGEPCVIKVFDLHMHRGLPGFIQEVMLHVRLRHPLVVPVRRAFIDFKEHRGFLQFDRYECNLHQYLQELGWPRREPHRLGEPAAAGHVDKMTRRIAQLMIQSVAHVHSHDVVHGDLKPSNWLWDAKNKVPTLCDFETAKDHGASATRTALRSRGYVAPELSQDASARNTLESDVFALGRSIEEVVQRVPSSRPSEKEELQRIVDQMLCDDPEQRTTAARAAEDWWREVLGHQSSDGYEHLVRANEVLYTQAECSGQFRDGEPLDNLIEAIRKDPTYPRKHDKLIIDVVRKGDALLSVDNRRLYCFHQAQEWHRDTTVWIKIREHPFSRATRA